MSKDIKKPFQIETVIALTIKMPLILKWAKKAVKKKTSFLEILRNKVFISKSYTNMAKPKTVLLNRYFLMKKIEK